MRSRLLLTGVLILLPAVCSGQEREIERDRRALHVGLACSIAADAADVVSTAVAFRRRPDAVEGNFLFGTSRDLSRILLIKLPAAVAVNGVAIWLHDDWSPRWAKLLLFGNCALKSAVAAHNLRIAFRISW